MNDRSREQIKAEVLELGEMLFDAAIEAAARQSVAGEETDKDFIEEMRATAEEFFTALHWLLEAKQRPMFSGEVPSVGNSVPTEQEKS